MTTDLLADLAARLDEPNDTDLGVEIVMDAEDARVLLAIATAARAVIIEQYERDVQWTPALNKLDAALRAALSGLETRP